MTFVVFAILLGQLGFGVLVFAALRDVLQDQKEVKHQRLADSAAIARIERGVDALAEVIQSEARATRTHTDDQVRQINAKIDTLVEAMRTVVHETPDFAITGEDGEVPVRRMRGLRSALSRMEELSRVAAGE